MKEFGENGQNQVAQRSAELFTKVFEYSNDAILLIDPDRDKILDGNPRACAMLGYSREELLSIPVSAVHPGEMPKLLAFAQSIFEQGYGWTNELTCVTKTGQNLPAEISGSVIKVARGNCLIALVRDISDRKRAEEALRQYSANLEHLVEQRTAELRRSEERQRLLLEINNTIVTNLERESLFRAVAEALRQSLSFDAAAVCLRDPGKAVFRLFALQATALPAYSFEVGTEFEVAGSHIGWVMEERRTLLRQELGDERQFPLEESLLAQGVRSYVVAPLLKGKEAIGTLNIASKRPHAYSEEDAFFLKEIAAQISLALENARAYEEIAQLKARLQEENLYLQEEIRTEHNFADIIGNSPQIKTVLKSLELVAPTDATVLVLGETGTGKELVARAVHSLSGRREKTLVKVNCAALPAGLIESELFGHERGAFTGALTRRIGRFELADGGTLFLDEIGDLPIELQAKLLRVLQEGEFERLGSTNTIHVDVRLIAATNRHLERLVEQGKFREDLYYRLNVFPIRLPPLRERGEDIRLLASYFIMKHGTKLGKMLETIPQASMEALLSYPWPGNIRELENVIERAVITSSGTQLALGEWLRQPAPASRTGRIPTLDELERQHIMEVLQLRGWRVSGPSGAARLLGLKPTTLEARMKKLGIEKKR